MSTLFSTVVASFPLQEKNSRSDYTAVIQSFLWAYGYTNVATDGIFGPVTEEKVRDFQKAYGFPQSEQDGVVGPKTWTAIANTLSPQEGENIYGQRLVTCEGFTVLAITNTTYTGGIFKINSNSVWSYQNRDLGKLVEFLTGTNPPRSLSSR